MKREIYEAMKRRIKVFTREDTPELYADILAYYNERGWLVHDGCPFYKFDADGLGDDYDSFIQPIRTKNLWNVAQRFYSLMPHGEDTDQRLLETPLAKIQEAR